MKKLFTERYGAIMINDALSLLLGKKLAVGKFRDVYEFALDDALVVKVEARNDDDGNPMFCNVTEFDIWANSKDGPLREWLAPIVYISPFGNVIVQRRTTPITAEQRPAKLPSVFHDLKLENWGMFEGRVVCHDYAGHRLHVIHNEHFELVEGVWHSGKVGVPDLPPVEPPVPPAAIDAAAEAVKKGTHADP